MGGKQFGFSDYEHTTAKKQANREKSWLRGVVEHWEDLIVLIEPHHPKTDKKVSTPSILTDFDAEAPTDVSSHYLSDPALEESLIEVPTMRPFAGIVMITDKIPDESTMLTNRHLLEKYRLGEQIFETVKAYLSSRGMTMQRGIIVSPISTNNKEWKRNLEMHQTKKGNQYYFGTMVSLGVNKDSVLIKSVSSPHPPTCMTSPQ